MKFRDPSLNAELDLWAANDEVSERGRAHNLVFDERIGDARRDAFEAMVLHERDAEDRVRRGAVSYYRTYVRVSSGVSQAFADINSAASIEAIAPELSLVRIESLSEPLDKTGLELEQLSDALGKDDPLSEALVEMFIEGWNTRPEIRRNPVSFAGRRDDLIEEIDDPDWAHRLRDRLGLAHYSPAVGDPIPVALMMYEAGEVLEQAASVPQLAHPFCAPTALDSEPWEYFFPSPKELSFGCPMWLVGIHSDDDLIVELVHPRLRYRREHLAKVGLISSPKPEAELRELRNQHLWALRIEAEREDFGEEL